MFQDVLFSDDAQQPPKDKQKGGGQGRGGGNKGKVWEIKDILSSGLALCLGIMATFSVIVFAVEE